MYWYNFIVASTATNYPVYFPRVCNLLIYTFNKLLYYMDFVVWSDKKSFQELAVWISRARILRPGYYHYDFHVAYPSLWDSNFLSYLHKKFCQAINCLSLFRVSWFLKRPLTISVKINKNGSYNWYACRWTVQNYYNFHSSAPLMSRMSYQIVIATCIFEFEFITKWTEWQSRH